MMVERTEGVTTPFEWNSDSDIIEEGDLKLDRDLFGDRADEAFAENALILPIASEPTEQPISTSQQIEKIEAKKTARASRRKKKPAGLPKRPLSAYNLFFQQERLRLQKDENQKIVFEEFGKIIGKRWKQLSEEGRAKFVERAQEDSIRYRTEMDAYKASEKRKADEEISTSKKKEKTGEDFAPDSWAPAASLSEPLDHRGEFPSSSTSTRQHPYSRPDPHPPETLGAFHERRGYPQQGPPPHGPPPQARHVPWNPPHPSYEASPTNPPQQPPPPPPFYGERYVAPQNEAFTVPPGMEITLPDSSGRERKYAVSYSVYTMSRGAAERYIRSFTPAAEGGRYAPSAHPESADYRMAGPPPPHEMMMQQQQPQQHDPQSNMPPQHPFHPMGGQGVRPGSPG